MKKAKIKNQISKFTSASIVILTGALFINNTEETPVIEKTESTVALKHIVKTHNSAEDSLSYNKLPISHPHLIVNKIIDSEITDLGEDTYRRKSLIKANNHPSPIIVEEFFAYNDDQSIEKISDKEYFADQILVQIDSESSISIEDIENETPYVFSDKIDGIELHRFTIPNSDINSTQDAIQAFSNFEEVKQSNENFVAWAAGTPNDPSFPSQWELHKIQVVEAWDLKGETFNSSDDPVVIAIVDTGIPISNVEIDAWENIDEIKNNGVDDDNNGYIDDHNGWNYHIAGGSNEINETGHGATVSYIASSITNNSTAKASPAGHVKTMALQALSAAGIGSSFDVMQSATYAARNGADIINISIIAGSDWYWYEVLEYIDGFGTLVCAAAGNEVVNIDSDRNFPACSDYRANLISVGASNSSDSCVSSYSKNYVDLFAPGSATSWASPLVASTAALILSDDPSLTPCEIKERILSGTDKIASLSEKCSSGGRLNALNSIKLNSLRKVTELCAEYKNSSITISWKDNATSEIAYEIERCNGTDLTPDNNWILISDTISANQTSYIDYSVNASENYFYRVRPLGLSQETNWSEEGYIAVNTYDDAIIETINDPCSIFADVVGLDFVEFSWNDNADNETAYQIQKQAPGESSFKDLATIAANSTNFSDDSLEQNSTYKYRVLAYNEETSSNAIELVVTTAQLEAPSGQITLSYEKVNNTEITLNWSDPFDNEDAFIIEYDMNGSGFYELQLDVEITANNTSLSLQGLEEGSTHSFRIMAVNASGYSDTSNTVEFVSEAPVVSKPAPVSTEYINFSNSVIEKIGYQTTEHIYEVQDNGATLFVDENSWVNVQHEQTITENTILEFDFKSTQEGEMHGIALNTSNNYDYTIKNKMIQLYGIQKWATIQDSYSEDGWQHYRIEIGKIFQGEMTHINLVNDGDATEGNSYFSNVKIYDPTQIDDSTEPEEVIEPEETAPEETETPVDADTLTIDLSKTVIENIAGQASEYIYEVQDNGETLFVDGNSWVCVQHEQTITEKTIIEFDFKSTKEGEIHAIALHTSNRYVSAIKKDLVQLYGIQKWAETQDNYSEDGWQHYRIEIGKLFQGDMTHIAIVNDGDSFAGNSYFSNIKIYEQ